jgi:hypothetical protein
VDFSVTNFADAKSCLELSSDHSPVLVTLSTQAILRVPQPRLCNRKTDLDAFCHFINERLLLNVPLKTDFEAAIKNFNDIIQWAGWTTTPKHTEARQTYDCPILNKQKFLNKRRLHRNWHRFRTPESKRLLNAPTRELKQLLADTNNASFQTLQNLSPTASTDYSLWKAAKKAKQAINYSHPLRTRETWARMNTEKAQTLADHLTSVFQPHLSENPPFKWKSLTNSNPRSAGFIDQKFKPSSTSNLKVRQATTSSRAKSFRNYLRLVSNISQRYLMLPCSQDSSLHNGK